MRKKGNDKWHETGLIFSWPSNVWFNMEDSTAKKEGKRRKVDHSIKDAHGRTYITTELDSFFDIFSSCH
jgi:hypothetical protein